MSKITQYGSLASPAANDLLVIVDVDDTGMAPTGTDKNITVAAMGPLPGFTTTGTPAAGAAIAITGASTAKFYAAAQRFIVGPDAAAQYPATPDGGTTDNTSAFQSAINAAVAWAQANSGRAKVFVEPLGTGYGINGGLVQNSLTTLGNSQLTLPVCSPTAAKVTLEIESDGTGSGQYHWLQTAAPQISGAALISNGLFANSGAQSTSISAKGNPAVLGGPNQMAGGSGGTKYGDSSLNFSNMHVVLKGLNFVVPLSLTALTYCPFDFSGVAQASVRHCQVGQATTYANTWSNASNISTLSGGLSWAGLMPANGNNDLCLIDDFTVAGGFTYGPLITEHTTIHRMSLLYCWSVVCISGYYFNSVGAGHTFTADQISAEGFNNLMEVFGVGASGLTQIDMTIDTEGTPIFRDDGNGGIASLSGELRMAGLGSISSLQLGATGLQVKALQTQTGWTFGYTGFSTAGTGVAVQNTAWRNKRVYYSGGTVTNVKAGGIGGTSAPTMTSVTTAASGVVDWPAGAWLSFTYTGSPTWNVVTAD